MSAPRTAAFGSWRSPITSDLIVAESISLPDVLLDGDTVYWLEARPREAGRCVLVGRSAGGSLTDFNPAPFNIRTRAHEYGGGAATVVAGTAYFSHFPDQRLYRQSAGERPTPLTPDLPGAVLRYADGLIDSRRNLWVGVREDHRDGNREAVNTLVAIDLMKGGPGEVIAEGNDFYSSPRLSSGGTKLAWLSWDHPNMPWDGTQLWVADVGPDGTLANKVCVAGGAEESIFQPEWSPAGVLHFVSDRSGWWNLYRHEADRAVPLCQTEAEFGQPQWLFGLSTYAFGSGGRIVCSCTRRGLGTLGLIDRGTGKLTPLELPFTDFGSVRARGDHVVFRGGSPNDPPSVVQLNLSTGRHEVLQTSSDAAARPEVRRRFSRPQPIEFPTEGGKTAHALYYPPANPDHVPLEGEKPPLLVKCHGGPTGSASSTLDLRIQFWTSRGIAVLDVNYGGSTGYGREYRQRLRSAWGVVDVDDCVNGALHLARQGLADEARMVITGGSAGGYTTLACLAFRDVFRGGGSHYGVSDLEALAKDTHKFESRYLDSLIGPYPERKDLYHERSPVHAANRVKVPVVFFQGDEDRVVPPDQTERMVESLRARGIPVGYLLFAGEQHGFRRAENIKRALDAELYFHACLVFRVDLAF